MRSGALMGALGVTVLTTAAATSRRSLQDHDVVIDKELLISAVEVVDSPLARYPGPWSFGHLMKEAFTAEEAPRMVVKWLDDWAGEGEKKSQIPARPGVRELLIEPWQRADGFQPGGGASWTPKFENAPFQLLAIANRMDLSVPLASFRDPGSLPRSGGAAYYSSSRSFDTAGGEGRFIFAVTDQTGQPLEPGVTLIFEYGLDVAGRHERFLDWAMAWHELGTHEHHDATYRTALAKVTRAFTDRREVNNSRTTNRPAAKPEELRALPLLERLKNGATNSPTQLMRIRTNDGAFGEIREFREFGWTAAGMTPAPLAGTPREIFFRKGTTENRWMARWLRIQRTEEVTATTARDDPDGAIPNSFALPATVRVRGKMVPVVASVAPVPENNDSYHWDGWGLADSDLRRAFSTQTCCGCHCGDTGTAFFHIAPRSPGEAAALSKYLRTDGTRWRAKDPDSSRGFLSAEMDLRKRIFEAALAPDLSSSEMQALRDGRQGAAH